MDTNLIERRINAAAGPIVWGVDDCAAWSADFLLDQTGQDLMRGWRGSYWSEETAIQELNRRGGGLVKQIMIAARDAGWKKTAPELVDTPALGIYQTLQDDHVSYACCVWSAGGWFMARGLFGGVTVFPATYVKRAWTCRQRSQPRLSAPLE